MALLGQALGQTSPGSKLWALVHPLKARGYKKYPLHLLLKSPEQVKDFFSGNDVWSACVPRPESGLSRGDRYMNIAE